jgi:hypothetical protein
MKQIKDANDLGVFKDILDLQVVDGNIEAITIRLGEEGQHEIRIVASNSYSNYLKILTEEFEETTRYKLHGSFMGMVDVYETFNDEYGATKRFHEYLVKADHDEEKCGLIVEPFIVLTSGTRI